MDETLNNSTIAQRHVVACASQKLRCQEWYKSAMFAPIIAFIFFNVLLALTAVLSNGLVFFVYYKNESLRKPANTILLSLAVTDFLTGAVSQPLLVYEQILMLTNCTEQLCTVEKLKLFVVFFLLGATLLNLSLSTFDRYIATFHCFRYLEFVTNSRVTKVVLAAWLALITIFTVAGLFSLHLTWIAVFLFPSNVIFISILYYKIFKEIRRLEASPLVAAYETEEIRKARERKSTETVGMILGLLFLCYIPMILFLLFYRTQHFLFGERMSLSVVLYYRRLILVAVIFSLSNSSLNVFVYYWKNSEIRSAMLKVIRPLTQRFSSNEVNPA